MQFGGSSKNLKNSKLPSTKLVSLLELTNPSIGLIEGTDDLRLMNTSSGFQLTLEVEGSNDNQVNQVLVSSYFDTNNRWTWWIEAGERLVFTLVDRGKMKSVRTSPVQLEGSHTLCVKYKRKNLFHYMDGELLVFGRVPLWTLHAGIYIGHLGDSSLPYLGTIKKVNIEREEL